MMYDRIRSKALGATLLLTVAACVLHGCGGEQYKSEEDFLQEVRNSSEAGEAAPGTLPPVGESMDHAARIRVETNEMDLGEIANDGPHFAKLKVFNDGKQSLTITRIDTSCACTQGNIPPERSVIPAGGETWIDVMVDPKRIPGFFSRKVLTITSTDPERTMIEVGVTARVKPEYEITTDELAAGDIMKGDSLEKRIHFRQLQEAPVTITKLEPLTAGPTNPKVPGISADFVEVPEAEWTAPGKREYEIILTIGPDLPAGPFERRVMLSTDVERFKTQVIYVRGTVLAPYRTTPLYPERALFGKHEDGTYGAHVSFTSESPVTLSDFEVDHPNLLATSEPSPFANQAGLNVTLKDPSVVKTGFELDEIVRLKVNVDGRTFDEYVGVRFAGPGVAAPHDHNH